MARHGLKSAEDQSKPNHRLVDSAGEMQPINGDTISWHTISRYSEGILCLGSRELDFSGKFRASIIVSDMCGRYSEWSAQRTLRRVRFWEGSLCGPFRGGRNDDQGQISRTKVFFMSKSQTKHDCYFCRVTRGETDPFIFENKSYIGIFDTNPVNPGHALVVPKRHVESLFDLNEQEQADYFDAIQGVKAVIEATDLADLYRNMLGRDYLKDRPKDHIETVLQLEFLGRTPDAYTIGNNDGREAGRSIDHVHVILLPRYAGDVENPRGGIRNVIPSRANYQRR
jgi:histidine triad (HIT) family protein